MEDRFKIYVEQLREGNVEKIKEVIPPDFLDIEDESLRFASPVELKGEAYIADNELVLHWDIETKALIPCSICNEPVEVEVNISNFYYCEPLSEIKTGIYDFSGLLRETILLEAPLFAECGGNCPQRKEYDQFLTQSSGPETEEGHKPFANLDW
jgi:uncharacterized metal-binding protein YceD (DUF177 family)